MSWKESKAGTKSWPAWDSEDGNYRIVDCTATGRKKPFRLMSFVHETDEGDPMMWDFVTLDEAKDHVLVI